MLKTDKSTLFGLDRKTLLTNKTKQIIIYFQCRLVLKNVKMAQKLPKCHKMLTIRQYLAGFNII